MVLIIVDNGDSRDNDPLLFYEPLPLLLNWMLQNMSVLGTLRTLSGVKVAGVKVACSL